MQLEFFYFIILSKIVLATDILNYTTSLESLMFKYGTDKSKDDHKYSDLYSILFDPLRDKPINITEIGVASGQSLQVWNEYFSNAQIFGLDIRISDKVKQNFKKLKRINYIRSNAKNEIEVNNIGFSIESMDIILDDAGHHTRQLQENILLTMWKYLKPGGYYIIEDVDAQRGGLDYIHSPELLSSHTQFILKNNDAFFVDAHLGHRDWASWLKQVGKKWAIDHRIHNSYVVVIRRRQHGLHRIQRNTGSTAMRDSRTIAE